MSQRLYTSISGVYGDSDLCFRRGSDRGYSSPGEHLGSERSRLVSILLQNDRKNSRLLAGSGKREEADTEYAMALALADWDFARMEKHSLRPEFHPDDRSTTLEPGSRGRTVGQYSRDTLILKGTFSRRGRRPSYEGSFKPVGDYFAG